MSAPTCPRSAFSTAQFFSLAIVGASLLSISVSWSQDWRSPGAQRCAVINCNGPAPAIRRPPPPPREPSAAELAREALDAAHEQAYSEIQAAMANHDYANALRLAKYQQALPDGLDFREFIPQMELYLLRNSAADAYTAGEYDRSAALFRQALQQDPDDQYARSNLELAQGRAEMARDANALANTVQDRRTAPAVAGVDFSSVDPRVKPTDVSEMARSVDALTNIAQDRHTAPTVAGLDFTASSSDLKDAPNDDTPSDKKTARGTLFNDRVAKPDLKTVHHQASGSLKADAQVNSAAATAKGGGDLTHNFDIGDAASARSMSKPSDFVYGQSVNPATFTDREKNAPGMPEALKRLGDLQAQRSQLEADLKKAKDERFAPHIDQGKMNALTTKVDQMTAAEGQNLKAIKEQEVKVDKIKRNFDMTVGGKAPAPTQPAAANN